MKDIQFKPGDTIPISGRISVTDDGVEQDVDFTAWEISCQLTDAAGVVKHDLAVSVATLPVFNDEVPSSATAGLTVGEVYYLDIRIKDELGYVRSTPTITYKAVRAVSATPT